MRARVTTQVRKELTDERYDKIGDLRKKVADLLIHDSLFTFH